MKQHYPPPGTFVNWLLVITVWLSTSAAGYSQQLLFQCPVLPSAASTEYAAPPARLAAPQINCADVQNIRVNVHFMQHDDGSGNFTAFTDGHPCNPSAAVTGYSYAQDLIWAANGQMANNPVLRLAPGSAVTNPPAKRIRWVLNGVYFDRSSFYRNAAGANGSPFRDHESLCVQADSVINIFLVEEIYSPFTSGTSCGSYVTNSLYNRGYIHGHAQADCATRAAPAKLYAVISSPWTNYILNGAAAWQIASALNHELCHLLGLNHPYQGISNCADAPANANCWNLNSPPGPDCDAWSKVSNNLMDYNADQSALSTCQIGIMQDNLNSCLQSRYVYKCSNCLPTRATFDLPESTCGSLTNIWLDGRASFHAHSFKLEIDLVSTTRPWQEWGPPTQHYEITQWREPGREQLDALFSFEHNTLYRVTLRTYSNCGSAAVRVKYLSTQCYALTAPGGGGTTSMQQAASPISTPRHD